MNTEQSSEAVEKPVVEKPAAPVDRRDALRQAIQSRPDRAREPDGKFAKEEPKETVVKPEGETVVETAQQRKERKYPSTWKKDYEPVYKKLAETPDYEPILDEIERRESEYFKGIEPYKESATFAQEVRKVMQPYESDYQSIGISPMDALRNALGLHGTLSRASPVEKAAMIQRLAQSYGVQLGKGEDAYDPMILQTIQQQNQVIDQLRSFQQQQLQSQVAQDLENAKKGRDFFDHPAIREKMASLVRQGLAKDAIEAYDNAVWLVPEIRAQMLAKQQAAQQNGKSEHVTKAKAAAVQVKGSPSPGTSAIRSSAGKDRREVIANAMRRGV